MINGNSANAEDIWEVNENNIIRIGSVIINKNIVKHIVSPHYIK